MLQPRGSEDFSVQIKEHFPDPKMKGLVYSGSKTTTSFSSAPCSHSLFLPSSPTGANLLGVEDQPGKRASWLHYYASCHRGAGGLLIPHRVSLIPWLSIDGSLPMISGDSSQRGEANDMVSQFCQIVSDALFCR